MMHTISLMYHDLYLITGSESGFQNASAFQYKIQVDEFERQVSAVSKYCKNHPQINVEFTFDDGGISFLTLAAPILEKYGMHGTFFISTNYLNTPLFLTSAQLQELVDRGHRIGSHSHTHAVMTSLSADRIADEWNNSVQILKKCVNECVTASIPNGAVNKLVMQKAVEAGVQILYTSIPSTKIKKLRNLKVLGRYVVYHGMSTEDVLAIVADANKRRRMYVRWFLLQLVKGLLGERYHKLKQWLFKR